MTGTQEINAICHHAAEIQLYLVGAFLIDESGNPVRAYRYVSAYYHGFVIR